MEHVHMKVKIEEHNSDTKSSYLVVTWFIKKVHNDLCEKKTHQDEFCHVTSNSFHGWRFQTKDVMSEKKIFRYVLQLRKNKNNSIA